MAQIDLQEHKPLGVTCRDRFWRVGLGIPMFVRLPLARRRRNSVMLGDGFQIDEYLDEIRKSLLTQAMQQASGVKAKAAGLLGMKHYQTLDAQLKRLGIE